ncbi:MAG: glycosyltransferase [Armatimonadia bacterium]|nr:glycosyltransferase [Armatimonadia bacterium]
MKVLHISSELAPYTMGRVGETVGALSGALRDRGQDVMCVLPDYAGIRRVGEVHVQMGDREVAGQIQVTPPRSDPHVRFVRNDHYYGRPELYGYDDEAERFIFLSQAALAACRSTGFRPDVIHCHDWQTGLTEALRRAHFAGDPMVRGAAMVFTIHNLAHQGCFGAWALELARLPAEMFEPGMLEFYGQVSFVKAGIVTADAITTVSPTYAREIQTEEFGENMHGVLADRSDVLYGILSGLDPDLYDPATDSVLDSPFSREDLEPRTENVRGLCVESGLDPDDPAPIGAFAGRLTAQAGVGLVVSAARQVVGAGMRLLVSGRGDRQYERALERLASEHPGQVAYVPGLDDRLERRICAGSHFFLRPAAHQPCGRTHMVAMRYGAIPIVRPRGGLADSVTPCMGDRGDGFVIESHTEASLISCVRRAVALHADPTAYRAVQRRAMARDFSWTAVADDYISVYDRALAQKRGGQ